MQDPLTFFSGFFCGGLIFGSLCYMSGKRKGAEEQKIGIYNEHYEKYLEWTPTGGVRLKKDVLEKEIQNADNDCYGIGSMMKSAIDKARKVFESSQDELQARKVFLDRCKVISEILNEEYFSLMPSKS